MVQSEHAWMVDFEPVADAPVPVGQGAAEVRHVPASVFSGEEDDDVGENRSGMAVVITNGVKRIEVGRIAFKAHLRRKSGFEAKLRDIVDTIAQPACDARNRAEQNLSRVRAEAEAAVRRATDSARQRVAEARSALEQVERQPIKHWDGEARIEAEAAAED